MRTRQRAKLNAKDGRDSWEITSLINPALDGLRGGRAQTELAQLCFYDLNRIDNGPYGSIQNLANEVKLGVTRPAPLAPGTILGPRDPWLPLPPKRGKSEKNETSLNYQAFEVFARLPLSERSSRRTAQILGKSPSLMERWSSLFDWVERANAWDRRLAEIAEQEWTAAVIAANRTEDEKWACRWVEFREEVWIELRQVAQMLKQLLSRPIMRVRTRQRAKPSAKEGPDSMETTSVIHPALDGLHAVLAQTELAELCFYDLKRTDRGSDVIPQNMTAEVKVMVACPSSLTPGTISLPRDPWLPLPPKGGKGGKNETSLNYQAFEVYGRLPPSERSIRRTAQILGKSLSLMEWWSSLFDWVERADAWDRRLAETSEHERTAAVIAANRTEDKKWACGWEEFREDAWIELSQLTDMLGPLISRPIMRVRTRQRAKPNAKDGPDSMEITWAIDPALDMLRSGRAQIELVQLCFGDLKLTDVGSDGSTEG
jgi:hypothetical protein